MSFVVECVTVGGVVIGVVVSVSLSDVRPTAMMTTSCCTS